MSGHCSSEHSRADFESYMDSHGEYSLGMFRNVLARFAALRFGSVKDSDDRVGTCCNEASV